MTILKATLAAVLSMGVLAAPAIAMPGMHHHHHHHQVCSYHHHHRVCG